jgi:predicted DNA binding CopG/RHH family protein
MRDHYDFSNSKPNPYAKRMKKQITIRLDESTVSYFKEMAEEKGIPYQSLINLYLRDCAAMNRELELKWS